MARKYRLKDWDSGDEPLNNPNASWRRDAATQRQIQRLKFFRVTVPRKLTKGEAADLLDALEPTIEELENYDDWKAAGQPNIAQWHRRHGWKRGGRGLVWKLALVVIGLFFVLRHFFATPEPQPAHPVPIAAKPAPIPAPTPLAARLAPEMQPVPRAQETATPRRVPTGPAAAAAQQRAIAKFPQLGAQASPLNRAFLERVRRYQTEKPGIFDDPEWPSTIAGEVFGELH